MRVMNEFKGQVAVGLVRRPVSMQFKQTLEVVCSVCMLVYTLYTKRKESAALWAVIFSQSLCLLSLVSSWYTGSILQTYHDHTALLMFGLIIHSSPHVLTHHLVYSIHSISPQRKDPTAVFLYPTTDIPRIFCVTISYIY